MVNLGDLSVLMFKDDYLYKIIPQDFKNYYKESHFSKIKSVHEPKMDTTYKIYYIETNRRILETITDHYWVENINFSVVDVGCSYGILSLYIGLYIKKENHENKIFSFDCGRAGNLCSDNIKINQLDDTITFEKRAISDKSGTVKVFFNLEHSEDNHIVDRSINLPFTNAESITFDKYFWNHKENLIIKIDTQGGEPLVFKGMENILQKKNLIVIFEFTPWVWNLVNSPSAFFKTIPTGYKFFNIDEKEKRLESINIANIDGFIERISQDKPNYTNILMIHETIPRFNNLIEKIQRVLIS